jgi:FMN phosphatase YigB (HAD superfamily)
MGGDAIRVNIPAEAAASLRPAFMAERTTPTSPPGTSSTGPAARQAQTLAAEDLRPATTTDTRLQPAFEWLADPAVSVLSLDIFDTLLWRKVPEPVHAFPLLAVRLIDRGLLPADLDPWAFGKLRIRAEWRARERREAAGRGVEVTLPSIWAEMPDQLFHRLTRDEGIAGELELERNLLLPDLDVIELVRAAKDRGKRVVGVSDTYFTESQLLTFLQVEPLNSLELDRVFASSTHGVGKGGGLWRVVLDTLGVKPGELVHVGDNYDADVAVPSGVGIKTVFFERRPETLARALKREEQHGLAPMSPHQGDYGLSALRVKVLHRTERLGQPAELRPFWDFGAAALGPALTGFAEWVHYRAQGAGASKVFCIMREGELLARLVNAAGAHLGSPVTAEPIWLSRQVCARASIVDGTAEELSALFIRRRMPTVAEFCTTLGLDVAEVPGFADRARARLNQPGLPEELVERITFDAGLRARVIAGSAELRARTLRYVESRLPPGEDRLALVDLGWAGTIQSLLDGLLREADVDCRTLGLYLLTTDRAAYRILDGSEMHGFLANAGEPWRPVGAFIRSPEILEQICMPEHGSQVGLTAELEPVLDDDIEPGLQAAERTTVQHGIMAFLREWARYRVAAPDGLVPLHDRGQDQVRAILVRALTAPTPDEAALFGRWLHDENFGSVSVETLVPPVSARAARYLDPHALIETPWSELYWPFGLAALHTEDLARALEATTTGVVDADAFSSVLETGPVEIYVDRGWGFRRDGAAIVEARRNRLGLSYARGSVAGDIVRRVRIDPAKAPCVLRLDWLRLRCHLRGGGEPVVLDFEQTDAFDKLTFGGLRPVGPRAFLAEGNDPSVTVDIEPLVPAEVHTVDVECGFALLPLPATGIRGRRGELEERVRQRAKRSRLTAPLRAFFSILRRFD